MNFLFAIGMLIASYVITAIMAPKPVVPKAAAFDEFDFPQTDEGTPQAIVFGDVWSPDWLVLWYGHYRSTAIKASSSGKGKGGGDATIGYRYYMGIMMGLCRGPVDEIHKIYVGDRAVELYFGGSIPGSGGYYINMPNLFGGDKKEGGIVGPLIVQMGDAEQINNAYLTGLLGGNVPDFRGVVTLLFDGQICALNPYPKKWKFRIRRVLRGWDGPVWRPEVATVWLENGTIMGMNPAHILYECATNRDWGRGFARTRVDHVSWSAAADTLHKEGFGLCMRWNRQDSLQTFIQSVLDHIGGTIYVDRETGLLTLRLIREDYDPNLLPLYDYNTGLLAVEDGETASIPTSVNEVIVKYRTPVTDEDKEVRAQNLASIQTLGAVNSNSTEYTGLATFDLASRVAQRDLRINTSAGRRYKVKLDRRAWRIYPGAVFCISAPDKGIGNLVLRAGKVTDGSLTSGEILVEGVIDVFGLSAVAFVAQQRNEWVPPDTTPVIATVQQIREMNYRDLVRRMSAADLALIDNFAGSIATMASKPTSLSLSYGISTRTGTEAFVNRNTQSFAPTIRLSAAIGPYDTRIPFYSLQEGGLIDIGDTCEIDGEIMRLDGMELDATGLSGILIVARGCVDTVPARHVTGAYGFFTGDALGTDGREYVKGESVDVKLLTITSTDVLNEDLAPTNALRINGRQGLPYPPGAVTVNEVPCFNVAAVNGKLELAWTHRDRKMQQDHILSHFDPSTGPEKDTAYTVRVYNSSTGTLRETFNGLSEPKLTIPTTLTGSLRFELEAVRNELVSHQRYSFSLIRS